MGGGLLFIISTSFDGIKKEGSFFWGENHFPKIRGYIPSSTIDVISITEGIIFFNRANQKEKLAYKIKINKTHITRVYLKIFFSITEELSYKSFQVRNALKQYFQKKSVLDLPFCSAVEGEKFYSLLKYGKLFSDISFYEGKNNWNAIYKMLENFMPVENSVLWDNAEALNRFSFATAKLSECSENLKRKFPDKEKRNQFIKEKNFFRKLTIKLRERCLELEPNNSTYYSNIAYTYYQSVNELNSPFGRKDGNIIQQAENAIKYFNKALKLDYTRITDYYRKAILLSNILASYILYNDNTNNASIQNYKIHDILLNPLALILEGIENFEKVVEIYENSGINSTTIKQLYKKYYIKSLYHIAQKKAQIIKLEFYLSNLLYGKKPLELLSENLDSKISLLNSANHYIEKCIKEDYNRNRQEKYFIDLVECNNFLYAVYKAYIKGVIETFLYILTDKTKNLDTAKEYFQKAMELNFPKEQKNQNKIFILDRIAILNLIEKKYDAAINLLEPLYNRTLNNNSIKFPDFAAHTLTISYILNENIPKAKELIEKYINSVNKIFRYKFNKLKQFLENKIYLHDIKFIKANDK